MNLGGNFQVQILTFGGLLFVLSILTASTGGNVLILPVPTPPQDGGPVTQGDLRQITPDSNEAKINEVLGYTGPDILLGDIISDAETLRFITQDPNSRNAITYPHGLWPSNTVPYIIDKSIGQQGVKAINDSIKDYHSQTCLKFVSRTTQKNYIRFTVGDGCSSSIGRTARGEQKINLHRDCWFKGVVIHEITHAIGFFHEQSRSDRDSYVKILYENIQKGVEDNFQKFDQGEIQHLGEPYDYSSIMHYGPNDFTRNGRPTIMGLRSGSNQMGQRKGFSANDVRQINKLYKCPAKPFAPGPDENSVEYCNFDSGSLCDFTQVTGDQFDWTLHKGPTRSGGTGPGTDMSGKGYYVYIETSTPRREGDRAVLLSPRLKGPYCLRMHYHMLGVNIGSLRVYKNSTSGNSVVFSVDGNKGDQWYSAEYSLTGPEQFQLAFEAVRGNGYRGDIALDEIKLVPGKCNASPGTLPPPVIKTPVKQKTTPEPPTRGEVYCNFDSRTFCQFTQTTADEFDWVLNKGNTPSAPQTGPRSDVSSTGYYIYAEASFPRQNGDRAQLLSPKLIGSYCLQFYYYMHGAQMGALHVLLVLGARRFKQFSFTGDQGQKWHKGEISNWGKHAYQLGFEAERGIGNTGDIALDEIRLKPGSCNQFKVSTQPPTTIKTTPLVTQEYCNFDNGSLCDFTQATGDQFDWTLHKGPTSTGGTGPGTDMSGKGYYVYIETSTPRRKGDRAVLLSPRLKGPYCLRMHYHMLGVNIGSLRVYKNSASGNSVVFSVDGNRGDQWYSAEYSLTGPEQFQLAFEAVRGNGYRGDIALDEIKLVPGKCNASPGTPAPPVIKTPVKQKTTPEPPTRGEVYCNFDSRTFCQFTQTTADEFDWVLNKGNTPNAPQTGPRSDVSSTGYYIYAEASFPRQNGDRAQLLSPKLIGSYCLQFYYYMHGAQMGALHVLLVLGARRFKLFSYTGNQGQKWHKDEISNWGKHAYQLGFEAERGIGNTGDIALDEIRLKPGSCNQFKVSTQPPTTIKTTPLVTQEYCNFDSGSLCDFTQATGDQFDWTLHKGPTSTGGTGPGTDMSGKGYYVYIETSTPRRKGDRAVLLSPRLKGPYCLRMHYHMLGVNIGSLRVYKNSASGNSVVFSVGGNRGDQWYSVEYSLTGPEQFQLAFEAVRGNGYRGDIALDEIKLVPGKCNASPGTLAPPVIKTPVKQKTTPEPPTRGEDLRCLSGWTKFGRSCYKSFDAKMLWHAAKARCQRDGASLVAINDAYELNFVRNLSRRIYEDYAVWIGLRRDSEGEFSRWENGEPLAYTKWFKNEPDNHFGDENCVKMFKYTGKWMDSTCTGESARSHPFICESELEKSKPQCPPGWDELSTACYKVYGRIRGMSPWADASKVCQASCASLVSITSPDEHKEVLSLMQHYSEGMYGYWIGLKRSFSSTFSWEDKSPLTYTKWARGEPNNWIRNEVCVYMSTQDGTWFDSRCSRYLPFICKLSLASDRPTDLTTPLPVTCGVKMNETSISSGLAPGVIVGGKVAIPGAWPWQVALLCKTCTDLSCGGTLISAYHVITAAHCIPSDTDTFVKDYKIRLGEHDIRTNEGDEQDIDIAAVYRHTSYGVTAPHDSDIAVIKLASPATFSSSVGPACLQSNNIDFPPDTECAITGWGRTRRRGGKSSVLRETRVPLVGDADCKKNYRPELITSNMVCAGNLGGGIDACQGDSGGPLVCEKDGRWRLVGTTSWGWGCGGQYYGVYTNIAELYEWIKENTK